MCIRGKMRRVVKKMEVKTVAKMMNSIMVKTMMHPGHLFGKPGNLCGNPGNLCGSPSNLFGLGLEGLV